MTWFPSYFTIFSTVRLFTLTIANGAFMRDFTRSIIAWFFATLALIITRS
jgi:hypothetical protein